MARTLLEAGRNEPRVANRLGDFTHQVHLFTRYTVYEFGPLPCVLALDPDKVGRVRRELGQLRHDAEYYRP
jgi:hypothetical protein